jgi:hypothetical protein
MEKTTLVNSASEFPSWKNPCPKCGSKYEKGKDSGISSRRDGSGAWCRGCGWNWKLKTIQTPEGWQHTGEALKGENKINVATEMLIALQSIDRKMNIIIEYLSSENFKEQLDV